MVKFLLEQVDLSFHLFGFQFEYAGVPLDGVNFCLQFVDVLLSDGWLLQRSVFRLGTVIFLYILFWQFLFLLVTPCYICLHLRDLLQYYLQLLLDLALLPPLLPDLVLYFLDRLVQI